MQAVDESALVLVLLGLLAASAALWVEASDPADGLSEFAEAEAALRLVAALESVELGDAVVA